MPWMLPAAIIGSSLFGASTSASAAKSAAQTSADAANRAADIQYKMFQEQQAAQEPWRQAGINALNKLAPLMDYQKFGMDQFQQDPGYAFRLAEGQKALDRQAAARGGLISGAALKAASRYGQEMGSQEYQNAFNRYQAERAAQLNPLQSLAGLGQTSANALTNAAGNYGSNVGNIYMQNAANQGNAALARGSAYQNAFGGIANYLGRSNLNFGSMFGGGGGGDMGSGYYDPGVYGMPGVGP